MEKRTAKVNISAAGGTAVPGDESGDWLLRLLCAGPDHRAVRMEPHPGHAGAETGVCVYLPAVHDDVHPSGCGSAAAQSGMEAHCAPQRAARCCAGLCAAPVFGGSGSGENCEKFLNLWQIGYPFSF